jgi:hypothetical protein
MKPTIFRDLHICRIVFVDSSPDLFASKEKIWHFCLRDYLNRKKNEKIRMCPTEDPAWLEMAATEIRGKQTNTAICLKGGAVSAVHENHINLTLSFWHLSKGFDQFSKFVASDESVCIVNRRLQTTSFQTGLLFDNTFMQSNWEKHHQKRIVVSLCLVSDFSRKDECSLRQFCRWARDWESEDAVIQTNPISFWRMVILHSLSSFFLSFFLVIEMWKWRFAFESTDWTSLHWSGI